MVAGDRWLSTGDVVVACLESPGAVLITLVLVGACVGVAVAERRKAKR